MAAAFAERWQSCAFQQTDYAKEKIYSAILSVIVSSKRPHELQLNGNQPLLKDIRLNDQDVAVVIRALRECSDITLLNLSYNDITGSDGAILLSDALQFNRTLKAITLDGNPIGRKGGIQVAAMLQVNRTLTTLGLARTDLDTDCIIAVATVLHGNSTLECVDLTRPLLHSKQEEPTIHISKMLQVNFALRELHLSQHGMTDTGMEWICRMLKGNSTLSHLDVSGNSLSRDGAGHMAQLLKSNSPLQVLDMSFNRIEDDGLVYLSDALCTNYVLQRLNVCSNSAGDPGLCQLANTLKRNTTIATILIWGNKIGEPTCNHFRSLLETGRLKATNIDVKPYVVDGITCLARSEVQC
eukprot:Em0008g1121a